MFHSISKKPEIVLVKSFKDPIKNIAATAKTCYSKKGIVYDEEIEFPNDNPLLLDLFKAGHHTTFEHAHFQFAISNVSRQLVWSLLHSHPFYNSEQVSQRFTEVKEDSFIIPSLGSYENNIYITTIKKQYQFYKKLIDFLSPVVENEYFTLFPARRKNAEKYRNEIRKKTQEIARYILPIGTMTYLYHTINLITIIRLYIITFNTQSTDEEKYVVTRMIEEISKIDPEFNLIKELINKSDENLFVTDNNSEEYSSDFKQKYDEKLTNVSSVLIDYNINAEDSLSDSVRTTLGISSEKMDNFEAIDIILNPEKNRLLSESLILTNNHPLSRNLNHIRYTFKKKISHTADSQNQRHRTIPASRCRIEKQDISEPDYFIPKLIEENAPIGSDYRNMINQIWENINLLLKTGTKRENIIYLLPNSYNIRLIESGTLLNYHHKYSQRLCYNAQEEIWHNSVDEVTQIRQVHPNIGKYLLPPCSLRRKAKVFPICPENKRYCGVKVWKLDLNEYQRAI